MKYELAYNEFRKPASVIIAGLGKPPVEYTYRKNSGKLKKIKSATTVMSYRRPLKTQTVA
ncbi:MAG: hypothetical protein ACLSVG_07810 [Clostridia bacterium]